jgi:hypothetical protein
MQINKSTTVANITQASNFFIVRLRGGIGNQLFQYAAARIYSITTNRPFKFDITGYANPELQKVPRGYKLNSFNTKADIATKEEVQQYKYPLGFLSLIWRGIKVKIFKLNYLDYHPTYLKKHIQYMDGYFQSPLYYTGHEELIRQECSVRQEFISDKARTVENQIQSSNSVSVHIRRGDLVTEIDVANAQGLCSLQYYERALGRIGAEISQVSNTNPEGKGPQYFVFSDDIYWVQDNMEFP